MRLLMTRMRRRMTTADAAPIPPGRGETILVVEDDPSVRDHSVSVLRELGYRVVAAADGHSALRMLARASEIEVLFTDIGLPGGMNGRQLAEAARVKRPGLKVFYTVGYARNAIVNGRVLQPGTELLPKPFSFAALAGKIRTGAGRLGFGERFEFCRDARSRRDFRVSSSRRARREWRRTSQCRLAPRPWFRLFSGCWRCGHPAGAGHRLGSRSGRWPWRRP
jgi:CheY-like chemotaxis protein